MAEFDEHLTALFRAPAEPDLSEALADRALARLDAQDRQRRLILITGGVAGIGVTTMAVARSGALGALVDLVHEGLVAAPYLDGMAPIWAVVALGLAVYGVTTFRTARAL